MFCMTKNNEQKIGHSREVDVIAGESGRVAAASLIDGFVPLIDDLEGCGDDFDDDDDDDAIEPVHDVALGYVKASDLANAELSSRDFGTHFDRMEAQYAGFAKDVDSDHCDRGIGTGMPLSRNAWENVK